MIFHAVNICLSRRSVVASIKASKTLETRNPMWKETCYALLDSLSHAENRTALNSQSISDVAKLRKIIDNHALSISGGARMGRKVGSWLQLRGEFAAVGE